MRVILRDNYTIEVSPKTIASGSVKMTIENQGSMTHGLGIEGLPLEQFVPSGSTTTREDRMPAGTWVLYCPVADHRDLGMRAELKVE